MERYLAIIRHKPAQYLLITSFPARIAYGMISLSIFFKVQQTTGSIAIAGLATGVNGIAGATTAGLRGALIDRFGMKIPLRFFAPGYAILILLFSTGDSKVTLVLVAFVLGFSSPPINLSVRPLWTVEGTFASLGAALGGFISEHYSPRYVLALTTVCVGIGYTIVKAGGSLLKEADRVPTDEEDEAALESNLDINK